MILNLDFPSQSEDDVLQHRQRFKQLFEPESISKPEYRISFGTQTDFREIEVQVSLLKFF